MKEQLLNLYNNTKQNIIPFKKEIIKNSNENEFHINFINGAKVEILGNIDKEYLVEFVDSDTDETIHHGIIKNNHWIKTNREWFTNWYIKIMSNGESILDYKLNLKNKRVYISFESKSLGDTIAWFPYLREFKNKHECEVIVSTFWNKLFKKEYIDLKFVEPGDVVENIHAQYNIGIFGENYDNFNTNKQDVRKIPLQQVSSDILGLEYKETKPRIYFDIYNVDDLSYNKYVCIAEHSTAKCKYWNNENGWQEVVDYLNSRKYKVINLSKESTNLKNVISTDEYYEIENTLNILYRADFFIGVSSGLAWLSWAINTPVIMISGFTKPFNEFSCYRVFNQNVCNGCWHDYIFDKGNWNWCPTNKNFECTKTITSKDVISKINLFLLENK